MKITAVILTRNEAHFIKQVLDSLKGWVDEIIIVDDHSTDETVPIAQKNYGVKVIVQSLNNRFDLQRKMGTLAASHEWILQMDADEIIPFETARMIREAVNQSNPMAGYEILRRDCVFDKQLQHVGSSWQLRLYQKKAFRDFRGSIHETPILDGPIGRMESTIWHYPMVSLSSIIARHNHYSNLEAKKYLEDHPEYNLKHAHRDLLFKTPKIFFKHYVKHKGFKDGFHGLIWSMVHTLHPIMFYLKMGEILLKGDINSQLLKKDVTKAEAGRS